MRNAIILIFLFLLWNQCANVQSPTGGPKDLKPPKIIASSPKANQTSFKSQTVELTFNESIKLNNPNEEIIISPSPGKEIEFRTKGNKVLITPKDPWADSTTYSILFREGIQDITESNSPPNLRLAFSTGPNIDSLFISGVVTEMLPGNPREKITVAIYSSDTFNIFTSTPSYFTKTNKSGAFRLQNIKAGSYKIYAFDDKNKNLKVESRSEMYAFINQHLNLKTSTDTIRLQMVTLDSRPLKLSSIRNMGTMTRIRFNKFLADYSIKSPKEVVHAFGDNQTEINFWNPDHGDSLLIQLSATDSIQNQIDSTFYIKKTSIKPPIEKFTWSLGGPTINSDGAQLTTTIKFSKPLQGINTDSLFIEVDTTSRIQFTKADLQYDPQHKTLRIDKSLDKKLFGADSDPRLQLMARTGFAISSDLDTTKVLSSAIRIYWPEENGTIIIQADTKRSHYILQLLDKPSKKIITQVFNTPKLTAKNIPPSEYEIRIIIDTNNNGKWDPGNIYKGEEPEKVIFYVAPDGAGSIPIRANWEIGPIQVRF